MKENKITSTNLTPKSLTGKAIMKEIDEKQLVSLVEQIERRARIEALDELGKFILDKMAVYDQVLYSKTAQSIYEDVHGEKFIKMYEKRNAVRRNSYLMLTVLEAINNLKYKKDGNYKKPQVPDGH